MFARKHKVQMCHARLSAASLSGLCSVAMRETLYTEVDLTDAVVNLVNQGHYSDVSVAIFGPTHPGNPKPGNPYLPHRRDKMEASESCSVRATGGKRCSDTTCEHMTSWGNRCYSMPFSCHFE